MDNEVFLEPLHQASLQHRSNFHEDSWSFFQLWFYVYLNWKMISVIKKSSYIILIHEESSGCQLSCGMGSFDVFNVEDLK